MRTAYVSTSWVGANLRSHIGRLQGGIGQLTNEIATGRMADVGLTLGAGTARSITLRQDAAGLAGLIEGNGRLSARLDQSQTVLAGLSDGANSFLKALVASGSGASPSLLISQSKGALSSLTSALNTAAGGRRFFAGFNTDIPPMADFAGAPKAAIDAAFAAKFGLNPLDPENDPAVSGIDLADMQSFLDNEFAALFDDPAWTTNWSSASDAGAAIRISPQESLTVPGTANDPAMRKLAMGYAMVASLGFAQLSPAAREGIAAKARAVIGDAIADLTTLQGEVGLTQQRVKAATDTMSRQNDAIELRIGDLEGVDPAEAKIRLDLLSTQLEMSYSLTARLSSLSILNYA